MDIKKVRNAIVLLNSMVCCGEGHTETSNRTVEEAMQELNREIFIFIAYRKEPRFRCELLDQTFRPDSIIVKNDLAKDELLAIFSQCLTADLTRKDRYPVYQYRIILSGKLEIEGSIFDFEKMIKKDEEIPIGRILTEALKNANKNKDDKEKQELLIIAEEEHAKKAKAEMQEINELNRLLEKYKDSEYLKRTT